MPEPNTIGLVVAVIGPDGSGKTTLIQGLAECWNRAGGSPARVHRRSLGILPRHRDVKARLTPWRKQVPGQSTGDHPALLRVRSAPRSLIYPAYLALDLGLAAARIRQLRMAGHLILFDRFFHDCYFQTANQRTPPAYLHILERLIPRPDLLLTIDRDPAEIFAAKPDLPVREITRQAEIVRRLVAERDFGAVLDGRAGPAACLNQATSLVSHRFPATALGRWFREDSDPRDDASA